MGLLKEFRDFAMRGNVVDLAVGVVIGGAFGKIVSSLVGDVIMPPIGKLIGGVNFSDLKFSLGQTPVPGKEGEFTEAFINYGAFVQTVIDFLIVAAAIFVVIKAMNEAQKRFMAKPEETKDAPPPPEDIQLLREIRDSLKKA